MNNDTTQTATESRLDRYFWKGIGVFLTLYALWVGYFIVVPAFIGEFARFL